MRTTADRFGFEMTRGALRCLALVWVLGMAIFGVVGAFMGEFDRDDTDSPSARSNMELLTDYGTGCQYLYRNGSITPRMGRDGNQVCK